jgi:hypothetical protein
MAFSRRVSLVGIVGAGMLFAVACADDGDAISAGPNTNAGEGGEATGGGGRASASGSSSGGAGGLVVGGHAGTTYAGSGGEAGEMTGGAGEGGMPPTAGTSTGGEGGVPAAAGQSGSGAGTAGSVGMAGGSAGTAGASGSGGSGGASSSKAAQCFDECSTNDDCTLKVGSTPYVCNQTTHLCQNPALACKADADCLPAISSWTTTCVEHSDCFDGFEECVKSQDQGYCASLSDPAFPDDPCLSGVPMTLPKYDGTGDIEVCGSPDPRCYNESCVAGCADDNSLGCGNGTGQTCSQTSGHCECQDGSECTSGVCGDDSLCAQCLSKDDCPASPYQNATVTCK